MDRPQITECFAASRGGPSPDQDAVSRHGRCFTRHGSEIHHQHSIQRRNTFRAGDLCAYSTITARFPGGHRRPPPSNWPEQRKRCAQHTAIRGQGQVTGCAGGVLSWSGVGFDAFSASGVILSKSGKGTLWLTPGMKVKFLLKCLTHPGSTWTSPWAATTPPRSSAPRWP